MSNPTPKILEVGDVVYIQSRYNGIYKQTVERLTPKKAKIGHNLVDNTKPRKSWSIGKGYDVQYAYLETPELKDTFERQQLIGKIERVKREHYEKMPTTQLSAILNAINGATK
jgi:hypothetical protein